MHRNLEDTDIEATWALKVSFYKCTMLNSNVSVIATFIFFSS